MEAVMNWATRVGKFIMAGPPKIGAGGLYNPQYITGENALKRFSETVRAEGYWGAYNKLRMESVYRKGTLVGSDGNGNKYYEDRNAPYGRTRWVEYPTPPGVFQIELRYDGSMVSPEWHGWLHYMHDKTGPELVRWTPRPFFFLSSPLAPPVTLPLF